MEFAGLAITGSIAAILAFLGYMIGTRKAYYLISGYNTMSRERKQAVDIAGLAAFMSQFCYRMAILLLVGSVLSLVRLPWLAVACFALAIPLVVHTLIVAQKYDRNALTPTGRYRPATKLVIAGVLLFLVTLLLGAGALLYQSSLPAEFRLTPTGLEITGPYGLKLSWPSVTDVRMMDTLPNIRMRTNGSAIMGVLKGRFKLADIGECRLYLANSQPPFVRIDARQTYILNCAEPDATNRLGRDVVNQLND